LPIGDSNIDSSWQEQELFSLRLTVMPLNSADRKFKMIPSKIIGKTSGENWVGLIDATYGIILTLLVIELPMIILESIEKNKSHANSPVALAIAIGVVIIGYFAIFTVIYDIWSYHKTLLFDAKKLRTFAISTGWILFLSSLVPPFYYLVNHFAIKVVLGATNHHVLLIGSRMCVFALITTVYLLLAALGKLEKNQPSQTLEKREELDFIFGTSLTKALITFIVLVFADVDATYLPPPIGVIIIAITTYIPVNFFKERTRKSRL